MRSVIEQVFGDIAGDVQNLSLKLLPTLNSNLGNERSTAVRHRLLRSHAEREFFARGDIRTVYLFSIIGILLLAIACIMSMTTSNLVPGERLPVRYFAAEGAAPGDSLVRMRKLGVDDGFVATYGLDIVAGRNFEQTIGRGTDRFYCLLNEAAVEALGWDEPIGKRINDGEVVGVVRNFHYASLHHEVEPLVMTNQGGGSAVSIRLGTDNIAPLLSSIEQVWHDVIPYEPFDFYFIDTTFDQLYHREAILGQAASYAAALAILIACLGLFGLSAFTTAQRTKEIGLRKVWGASIPGIILLLYQDFLKPVSLAFLIAAPVAYLVLWQWLQAFVYRIEIGPGVFLLAGGLLVSTALLTVSYQAIRVALMNPVESLRYE